MSAAEALAPEQSVDEVRESLSVTEKGQPANTIGIMSYHGRFNPGEPTQFWNTVPIGESDDFPLSCSPSSVTSSRGIYLPIVHHLGTILQGDLHCAI